MTEPRPRWWTLSDFAAKAYYPLAAVLLAAVLLHWNAVTYTVAALMIASVVGSVLAAWLGLRTSRAAMRQHWWAEEAARIRERRTVS
jgi:hypothetical protein